MPNPSLATLTDALLNAAELDTGITFLEASDPALDQRISYRGLLHRSLRVLSELQRRNLSAGSEVVFQLESNQTFVDAFWACVLGGMLPIPLNAGATDEHLRKVFQVLRQTKSPTLLTQGRIPERLWEYARRQGFYDEFKPIFDTTIDMQHIPAEGPQGTIVERTPEYIASLQYSSGSTGNPKGVVLTHANLIADINSIIAHCGITQADSHLSWVPLTHDLGMVMFHLLPIVLGVDQHLMPASRFARRPLAWLESASRYKATVLSSPNFGYQHFLKAYAKSSDLELDLSAVRIIFNGAEPIAKPLCDEFLATLAPSGLSPTAICPAWGLAEATVAVTIEPPERAVASALIRRAELKVGAAVPYASEHDASTSEVVRVGVPISGSKVEIRDDQGTTLPQDYYGNIFVHGPMVSPGYYGEVLEASGRWLDTGDQGFIREGALYICGRRKDTIIVNGVNYHPNDLERACCEVTGMEPGKLLFCSASKNGGEKVLAFVVHRQGLDEFKAVAESVRRALSQQAQLEIDHVLPIRAMPKTTSGKVQRFQLGERYLEGEFDEVISRLSPATAAGPEAAATGLEQQLLQIVNETVPDASISLGDNLVEAGVSSLSLAEIAEALEQLYPDVLELSDFLEYPTIPELAAHISQQLDQT